MNTTANRVATRRLRVMVAACLTSAMAWVACGGGGGNPATPSPTPTPPPAPTPTPTPTPPSLTGLVVTGPGCSASLGMRTATVQGICMSKAGAQDIQLTATAQFSDNSSRDVTAGATWATTNANVASVSSAGRVTLRGPGDADVTATYQGRIAGQTIHVEPAGPRTSFGSGTYLVNRDIVAGRYFAVPSYGCYFERLRGLGGSLGDILANEFVGFSPGQWIVDIASSDLAFKTDADCNTWYLNSPRRGASANISPGMWLVGAQIAPGTYRTDARGGCYWERLRDFSNTLNGVLDNDYVSSGGQQYVTIRSSDAGFSTDDDCGTWTPVTADAAAVDVAAGSTSDIERHWLERRATKGPGRYR